MMARAARGVSTRGSRTGFAASRAQISQGRISESRESRMLRKIMPVLVYTIYTLAHWVRYGIRIILLTCVVFDPTLAARLTSSVKDSQTANALLARPIHEFCYCPI